MIPVFFSSKEDFYNWLKENHKTETELIVGFYKVGSGRLNMTWSESVDMALCFGWIDGIRKSIDKDSYCIRFTPRKPTSIWSDINIKKVEELTQKGLMTEAGLKIYNKRKEDKSRVYSFENGLQQIPGHFEDQFKSNLIAWAFFSTQPPSYQKATIHWIMSAKQEKTKSARLEKLIQESEKQNRVY